MKSPFTRVALCTLLFMLIFSGFAYSQDDIIMRNDDVTKAKVEEVGTDIIRYRKADNPDGPIYDMPKSNVYMIVYANGARDVINPRPNDAPPPAQPVYVADGPIRVAPPEMPVYEQPLCPTEGYLWTPGYWAFGPGGFYWVPGVWISPPRIGYLWTPGYWGYAEGIYGWHVGYWGEHIGFYGGVNYGYGYGGMGYEGGRWEGGAFRYNTAVTRVDVTVIHTTYVDNTVVHNNTVVNHSSFNGGTGIKAEPTATERVAMNETHVKMTPEQQTHVLAAKNDKSQYVSENHGHPATPAMNKPNGQHFNAEGKPAAHTSVPVNNTPHTTAPNNGEEHRSNAPANGSQEHNNMQQHTAAPGNNTTQQHSNTSNNAAQEHTETNTTQQHTNSAVNNGSQKHHAPQPQKSAPKPQPQSHPAPKSK